MEYPTIELESKKYEYLVHLYDTPNSKVFHEFFSHSKFFLQQVYLHSYQTDYNLHLIVDPEIYKNNQDNLRELREGIRKKIISTYDLNINSVKIIPDLVKFKILDNHFVAQNTPWKEINNDQENLLKSLKIAKSEIDFQNIGNSSRIILQKVADIVFDPKIHISDNPDEDLSKGKFKNRLNLFIKTQLAGKEKERIRGYSMSIIESTGKAIDLTNTLTHDLKANSLMAESSVIGVLTTLAIIKLIRK